MNALTIMRRDEQTELAQVGASQLQQWIMEFFVIKMTQKSEHTKRAYLADLQILAGQTRGNLSDASLMKFASYVQVKAGYAPRTSNRILSVCRKFMRFLCEANYVHRNYLDLVEGSPIDKHDSPYVALTDAEVQSMLQIPDRSTLHGASMHLALVLGFYLGLRRSEMAAIRLGDIDEAWNLRVRGKGNKVRVITLDETIQNTVRTYLVMLGAHNLKLGPQAFLLAAGGDFRGPSNDSPIGTNTIWRMFHRAAESAGVDPERVSPHGARATMITKALDAGVGIRDVANMAGHRSIETTSIYDKRRDTSAETVKKIKY
jgi:integrase/recombinase XerD